MTWDNAYMNPLGLMPEVDPEQTPEDARQAAFEKAAQERWEYCLNIAKMFKTPHGKKILKTWRENTIESSAFSPMLAQQSSLEAANAHAYAREGQNAFVRDIENCIEIAHTCKTLDDFCARINQLGTANQI